MNNLNKSSTILLAGILFCVAVLAAPRVYGFAEATARHANNWLVANVLPCWWPGMDCYYYQVDGRWVHPKPWFKPGEIIRSRQAPWGPEFIARVPTANEVEKCQKGVDEDWRRRGEPFLWDTRNFEHQVCKEDVALGVDR